MRAPPPLSAAPLLSAAKTHARLIKSGAASDTHAWNAVLTAYSRSAGLARARDLFDEIPQRDSVSWNALIAAHASSPTSSSSSSSSSSNALSWDLFRAMRALGLPFDHYTLGSVLKAVARSARLQFGRQLHSLVLKSGLDRNVFSASALVGMYAKCASLRDASRVFEAMPERNAVSWNALLAGYAEAGEVDAAFRLFGRMERASSVPDEATFASLLTLVDGIAYHRLMCQLHGKIVKYGQAKDSVVCNAAITAYSQCGLIGDSIKVFDKMEDNRDLITWNSMLAAYACHGLTDCAMELFVKMQEFGINQDMYTFTSVISSCTDHGHHNQGRILHGLVTKRGLDGETPVFNALIAMYIRTSENGMMEDAVKCFDSMEFRDSVTWNSILTGLSQNGLSTEALRFFGHMRSVEFKIDHYAFSAVLRSCSDLAILQLGQQIHGLVLRTGFASNDFVASSLIFMYSKCGVIDDARSSFHESDKCSSVSWNSIIFGYAQHGQARIALDLFTKMQERKVPPDHITFVGLISACSHIGLVEEGFNFLKTMESKYGVAIRMEHYACGVDLFGRAGRLDEAKELIDSMPFKPDATVWMTLLGACRIHGNMELASEVAKHLLEAEPREHSTYVLLSCMYSGFGMWNDRALLQREMRNRGLSKVPGWSWIEVKSKVHSFNAEDRSHPQAEEIYEMIVMLIEEIEVFSSRESEIDDFEFG
ncbi:putative pentatricopeptide repeat-containing protein At3g25970 [Ananas comosus]|uniref:Pentatricopeptide repeat-containing protein At3g25970 n=1 Tax=Ananas comosus TaxID=4615 RepID=A0A6P5FQJ0_ANACO|nr:putative pentatricopeptide repeat-containing protein At3g25970 [Ananas comosus]